MTTLAASLVVTPDRVLEPGVVEFDDGTIVAIEPTSGPVPDRVLVPGLIDLQVNGIDDVDVASADGADWERLDELLIAQGVTAWCPTLVSGRLSSYSGPLRRIADAAARPGPRPAILGAHLEGPFLGARPGAHPPGSILAPDLQWLADLPAVVVLVTLGAEVAAAEDAIRLLVERGVCVSIGHSGAELATARRAVDFGARLVTHGYNAMSALDHRAPGMVGEMLVDDRVAVSLIADLVHVHPVALDIVFRCKPPEQVVLVTDAVAWRRGTAGGVTLVHDGRAARLPDGTLAGSSLGLDEAIANVVRECGVPVDHAVAAATANPAGLLGLQDRGMLEPGKRADVAALDSRTLRCASTWIGGEQVYG